MLDAPGKWVGGMASATVRGEACIGGGQAAETMQADPNWDTFAPFDDDGSARRGAVSSASRPRDAAGLGGLTAAHTAPRCRWEGRAAEGDDQVPPIAQGAARTARRSIQPLSAARGGSRGAPAGLRLCSAQEKIRDADAAAQEPLGADGFPETGLVAIHLHPPDSVAVPDLIKTQNELLDKVCLPRARSAPAGAAPFARTDAAAVHNRC